MTRLLALGALAALFFSSTFVLNRAISLEGGHWVWTASLRYGWMLLLLTVWLGAARGPHGLAAAWALFRRHWVFWTVAGSVGFGVFYALLVFSVSHAAGWVVAATWQVTLLASPLVLLAFGRRVPARGVLLTLVIFAGILLVNAEHASSAGAAGAWLAALPVVVAAFAYPLGNQMVWEARRGGAGRIPRLDDPVLEDRFAVVWLMTLGSLPLWALLALAVRPPAPSAGQLWSTGLVAVLSGVLATALFLHARQGARDPYELAAVDSTQSMEVVFSLAGEVLLLGAALPGPRGWAGIALTGAGLVLYLRAQTAPARAPPRRAPPRRRPCRPGSRAAWPCRCAP
ncbi:MAG TPA: multidrug resistance efflux transporter family protein, partial [Longimicrobiaceae bacterium]|nr:multidrug resistance efflux transporter family protein [Longimicrobiaceae bacterium]